MPEISVIVPVYNTELFLNRCINSIINQSHKNIEIIIINDGSTDQSEKIILEFCASNKRIRYFKQENIGLGRTRNRGIELALGTYLAFIDSDDYIRRDMLEKLVTKAKNDRLDIVCSEVYIDKGNKLQIRKKINAFESIDLSTKSSEEFYKNYYFSRIYSHNAWDKLYKRIFIIKNNIYFGDNKLIFAEDNYFQFQVLLSKPSIGFLNQPLYFYVKRDGSIMNNYKENLICRNMNMIRAFNTMNPTNNNLIQKVIDVITFDILIEETMNIIISGKNFSDLRRNLSAFYQSNICEEFVQSLNKNKSYQLEPNKKRRAFICLLGKFYNKQFYLLADVILYTMYKYFKES